MHKNATLWIVASALVASALTRACASTDSLGNSLASVFPIVMYDSDIGFGLGIKSVVKNHLHRRESFDLTAFGSSKGEQWYVFGFSIPDGELRQGTSYPLACDLSVSYDKYLKSNFLGVGNASRNNADQFPREQASLGLTLSRAFTRHVITEVGCVFNHVAAYHYETTNPILRKDTPGAGERQTFRLSAAFRWDTRDSQIHPHRGYQIEAKGELAARWLGGDFAFQQYAFEADAYYPLFNNRHVCAVRFRVQQLEGIAPYYDQSSIGGGWTARGFKADRFIDHASTIATAEYRFPLYRKLGGVAFVDEGRVYANLRQATLHDWKTSYGLGLRYYLANFVVRGDIGFSAEGSRMFLNFGQVF